MWNVGCGFLKTEPLCGILGKGKLVPGFRPLPQTIPKLHLRDPKLYKLLGKSGNCRCENCNGFSFGCAKCSCKKSRREMCRQMWTVFAWSWWGQKVRDNLENAKGPRFKPPRRFEHFRGLWRPECSKPKSQIHQRCLIWPCKRKLKTENANCRVLFRVLFRLCLSGSCHGAVQGVARVMFKGRWRHGNAFSFIC